MEGEDRVDLPHCLNGVLIEYGLYWELVLVNSLFRDYFAGLAVLVAKYTQMDMEQQQPRGDEFEGDYR